MNRYFKLIQKDIDVAPLLAEIDAQNEAWLLDTGRQDTNRVQKDTHAILLRKALRRPDIAMGDNQECITTPTASRFLGAMQFLNQIAASMESSLSRAAIVRLKPRSGVGVHVDPGSYYFIRNRFHLVLRSPPGSLLRAGDEEVRMNAGELWWFNNKQYHSAFNGSDEWRIHCIFDLLPPEYASLAVNPVSPDLLPPDFVKSTLTP